MSFQNRLFCALRPNRVRLCRQCLGRMSKLANGAFGHLSSLCRRCGCGCFGNLQAPSQGTAQAHTAQTCCVVLSYFLPWRCARLFCAKPMFVAVLYHKNTQTCNVFANVFALLCKCMPIALVETENTWCTFVDLASDFATAQTFCAMQNTRCNFDQNTPHVCGKTSNSAKKHPKSFVLLGCNCVGFV